MSESLSTSLLTMLWLLAKEHKVEEIFWWDKFFSKLVMTKAPSTMLSSTTSTRVWFFPLKRINISNLVIDSTFLWIRQASHRGIYFLKSIISLGWIVLVWMDFECFLSVCFFENILICISFHAEHLVITLTSNYLFSKTVLISSELFWSLLRRRCCLLFLFFLSPLLSLLRCFTLNLIKIFQEILGFTCLVELYAFD